MLKRKLSAALSLLLAFAILIFEPAKIYAASIPEYIKEIKIATGSSQSEVISTLEGQGYTVFNCNLYDSDDSFCYMGYITTTDESEAITDVRLMNAGGGISEVKYRDLVAGWKTGIQNSAKYFRETCLEVKSNYENGSPLAAAAVELLDIFEVDGVKLSDYLFDSSRKDEDYQDILLICADNVVSVIYSALNIGTADYNVKDSTDNFATRLSSVNAELFDYDYIEKQADSASYVAYWDSTARVISQLQSFTEEYDEAVEFLKTYKEENNPTPSGESAMSDEELCDYWKQFVDDSYKNSTDTEEQDLYKYATVVGTYVKLSEYSSFSSAYKNLAEYIYMCGYPLDEDGEESDKIYYRIYPLVSALTSGQVFALQYGGLTSLVSALGNNVEGYENQASAATEAIKEKIAENGLERISVFYNVNRQVYNETVAFTDEAHRVATASSTYDSLTRVDSPDDLTQTLTNIILIGGMVACSLLAATVLFLGVSSAIFGTTSMTLLSVGYIAMMSGSIAIASGGMTLTTAAIVTGIIGVSVMIVVILVLAVLVICALIGFFKSIFSDDDDEEEIVYPDMPEILFDVVDTKFTQYHAVTDLDNKLVDINGGEGNQWDGLYYTYDTNAGSPIKASGDAFTFSYISYVAPSGYVAVKRFGYTSTANLNTYKKGSKNPLYIFFASEESVVESEALYLYDIKLLSGDSAEEVVLGLTNQKYTVLEQDLTPNSKKYTYLGYKTTERASDAITDIRIAYYYDAEKVAYGTTSSGTTAEYAFVGQLNTMASLYYVKQSSNGSPILADLIVTEELLSASSGYEPVNLFSGGNAFNLIIGSNSYNGISATKESAWDDALYLYFRPSVAYTDGTEYISGFAFSSDFDDDLEFAAQCGFKPVESLEGYNLSSGLTENPTYLLYSTTYNPYRAITEIRTYTAQNASDSLFENITVGTTGYVACETFACVEDMGAFSVDYYRMLRPSNSFISRNSYEGGCKKDLDSDDKAINNLGRYEEVPQKGLYVAGPSSTAQPLTMDDVWFCTDEETTSAESFVNAKGETVSCRPASDLKDCYSTEADNLTFEWDYYNSSSFGLYRSLAWSVTFDNYLRIFYRGSVPTRGKYVSNIYVATVEPEEDSEDTEKYISDQAIAKALSYGEGELIKVNLSCEESDQPYTTEEYTLDGESGYRDVYSCYSGTSSYMFVTYTDYRIESMRSATRKWYSEGESTTSTSLSYQNTNYTRGGDVVKGISGDYGIFTSSNGQLGLAITDVILDTDYLTNGCISISDYIGTNRIGEDYILKFSSNGDVGEMYYTDIVVASASSRDAALKELYQKGCNGFIDQDKNNGGGGDYVYIGYKATADADAEGIITGLKIVLSDTEITGTDEPKVKKVVNDASESTTLLFSGPSANKLQKEYEAVEEEMVYTRVSDDLNKGVKGDYSYLYISRSSCANPITSLTTTTVMAGSVTKFIDYESHNWITTANASNNSKADMYCLCYRQQSSDWTFNNEYGELSISTDGEMENYKDKVVKVYGLFPVYFSYYPEWYDYADSIIRINIGETVTRIDDCAFRDCDNVKYISIMNPDCVIEEGSLPEGAIISGYPNSTASEYAASHGMEFFDETQYRVGTILGNGNVVLVATAGAVLCLVGVTLYVVKRKKSRQVKSDE